MHSCRCLNVKSNRTLVNTLYVLQMLKSELDPYFGIYQTLSVKLNATETMAKVAVFKKMFFLNTG